MNVLMYFAQDGNFFQLLVVSQFERQVVILSGAKNLQLYFQPEVQILRRLRLLRMTILFNGESPVEAAFGCARFLK
jgi:hypothetical protein